MKINWFSNAPWASTGYGNQTRLFTQRIKYQLGYDVSITGMFGLQGGRTKIGGIDVYPSGKHVYSQDIMSATAVFDGADIIISLYDLAAINTDNIPSQLSWFPWFPVDCEPMPRIVAEKARCARKGITMSLFGQRMAENIDLDTFYIPHGVETKVFRPLDRVEARKRLEWPDDKFIVGIVAANKGNPPRKSWFELIMGFAAFHKAHPDSMLYIHSDDGRHGGGDLVDLVRFVSEVGLKYAYHQSGQKIQDVDVLFAEPFFYHLGLPDDYMVDIYNAFDVMLLASLGEGFGIPLIESQACGCPVITGDWTSMGELCISGWRIDKSEAKPIWDDGYSAWRWSAHPEVIADRLASAYRMKDNQDYRKRARTGALAYDADKITEKYWKPTLKEIEDLLSNTDSKMELVTF